MIDLATRRVHIARTTWTPNEAFMANLTDAIDGFLGGHTKLIIDRDAKFSGGFQALLTSGGVETVFAPPRAPNCNAYAERFSVRNDQADPDSPGLADRALRVRASASTAADGVGLVVGPGFSLSELPRATDVSLSP